MLRTELRVILEVSIVQLRKVIIIIRLVIKSTYFIRHRLKEKEQNQALKFSFLNIYQNQKKRKKKRKNVFIEELL